MAESPTDPYVMTPLERSRYDQLFPTYAKDGHVHGKEAVELFSKSGLTTEQLRDIWNLVDNAPIDNRLDQVEFALAMHLIVCIAKRNMPLPQELPPSLLSLKKPATSESLEESTGLSNDRAPLDFTSWTVPTPPDLPQPPSVLERKERAESLRRWVVEMEQAMENFRIANLELMERADTLCAFEITQLERKRDEFVSSIQDKMQTWISHQEMRVNEAVQSIADLNRSTMPSAPQDHRNEPPQELICSITLQLMSDPVIAMDGHTYERHAIEDLFARSSTPVSPMTNIPLPSIQLIPNVAVRSMCREYQRT